MQWAYLGTLNPTDEWQWLVNPVTDRETFKLIQRYNYQPGGYLEIAQAYLPDYAITTPEKVKADRKTAIVYLLIPQEIYLIEERSRYIGLKMGWNTYLVDLMWSVDIYSLIIN